MEVAPELPAKDAKTNPPSFFRNNCTAPPDPPVAPLSIILAYKILPTVTPDVCLERRRTRSYQFGPLFSVIYPCANSSFVASKCNPLRE